MTTPALIAKVSDKADKFVVVGGKSLDIIPLVVGVGAGESLAARDRLVGILWEEHLDTVDVVRVDNGGDIKVGCSSKAVESNLAKHAWDIFRSLGDRVKVTNPSSWEGDIASGEAFDSEFVNGRQTLLCGEDNGTGGAVLIDKVNCVGGSHGCKRGGCEEDSVDELHVV